MDRNIDDGGAFLKQAAVARGMGSEFVAKILEAGLRQLRHAPVTAQMIENWPRDRGEDAVPLRFNGALHALAMRGASAQLSVLYGIWTATLTRCLPTRLLAKMPSSLTG